MVAFADSTVAALDGVERAYDERLAELLRDRGVEATSFNAAGPGETLEAARRRFDVDVLHRDPDVVLIQFGINDAAVDGRARRTDPFVSQSRFAELLEYYVRIARSQGAEPVLLTPNPLLWAPQLRRKWRFPPYDLDDRWGLNVVLRDYAEVVRQVAASQDVELVDVFQTFVEYESSEGTGPSPTSTDELLADGMHPSDRGHALIAQLLADPVLRAAERARISRTIAARSGMTPGFGIPVVDLARDHARQVVVDREANQYLGHPDTVLLADGHTMLAVYPKGHGTGAIVMKRSDDGGATWSERLSTPLSFATSRETPTIYSVPRRSGNGGRNRLLLFSGLHPIRMARSDDEGATWSELEPIGDFGGIVAMASLAASDSSGRLTAFFHDDGRFIRAGGERQRKFWVYQTTSSDAGRRWSQPEVIATHAAAQLCEPGLVRSPDGSQMALLLRENSRTRNSFVIFSDDEGKTWSMPRELPAALTGDRHAAVYAPDGRLFISFRDTTRDSPTKGDWVGWVGHYDDIIAGREGEYRVRLMDNLVDADAAYPGVELLAGGPDRGMIVATSYGHWTAGEEPYIVSVRFRLEELDEQLAAGRQLLLPSSRSSEVAGAGMGAHEAGR